MKKHVCLLVSVLVLMLFTISGCGSEEKPVVTISIWTGESNYELLKNQLEEFKKLHADEADFVFTVSVEGEDTCKSTVLANPDGAADLFAFADDQLDELYDAGALLKITENTDVILNNCGGNDSGAATAIIRDGDIYAYPLTAGNGYFLYYNSDYYTPDDIKTLDRILEVARENNKKFTMDLSSGWYMYSFYKGAGLNLENVDGHNVCDWNSTENEYTGVDVTNAILAMTADDGFVSYNDDGFVDALKKGEIIAGVNGPWNAENVSAAWGEAYSASMLPTYTINDSQVQMYSFIGFKLLGINSKTKEPEWCMKVAEYITNEENQLKRFADNGEIPANINAAGNEIVLASPASAALATQSEYGSRQSVADPFWDASYTLGITLISGNPDNKDLQKLLDDAVNEITKQ